jgi:hypothetical protein
MVTAERDGYDLYVWNYDKLELLDLFQRHCSSLD